MTETKRADPPFINKEKITALLPMQECISVMEDMFRAFANGECVQPLRSLMWLPEKQGLMGMMPGYAKGQGVMAIKVISIFPGNHAAGYPSHQGVVLLFGGELGEPLLMLDASEITAIRTAAASAVATKFLANPGASTLAIIGTGEQAERHIEAICLVRKIERMTIWGRSISHAAALREKISGLRSIPVEISSTVQAAVKEADIICTVTAAKEPVLAGGWIASGAHVNAVGSSTPGSRELDSAAMRRCRLYTDCYESLAMEAGDFIIPCSEGMLTQADVQGELGEVIIGRKTGRKSTEEITVFKSLGIAMEDLFAAMHIYRKIQNQ